MKKNAVWYKMDDDSFTPIGVFPIQATPDGDYICPQCGEMATYWEGQIDQDQMGNDIDGWGYYCSVCGICIDAQEF